MLEPSPGRDSLVLYRSRPACVRHVGKKLEIELEGGERLKVRPKDVVLLHPGPVGDLPSVISASEQRMRAGEAETAWELLTGDVTSLAGLAELLHGEYTPATAWAAWGLVADDLYFSGTPGQVAARTREEVAAEQVSRRARAEREQAWEGFVRRVRAGKIIPEDGRYLRELEDLALGRTTKSQLLRELDQSVTPENAHALLLDLGYWDHTVDPYPQRLGLPTAETELIPPPLPEEVRADLTHLVALAIDDEGNQEPDDALSMEGDRLWVHVADVAAVVLPGSAADLEARGRGSTLYLPEGMVPMLPREAIQRLGLGLAEVSPALSLGLDLTAEGRISEVEVAPSWVRVTRLTYAQAEACLGDEPLDCLYNWARRFQALRQKQGAIGLDLPEVKIHVEGDRVSIAPVVPLRSRELVTEAMLAAGVGVARFALEHGIAIPFTTQDSPETEERPTDLAGMYELRRYLRPSEQSGVPGVHAGLGLEVYAQATSPLRRYLDLVVHQQLRAHLRGVDLLSAQEVLERIGATAAVAGIVRQVERLARRHWTLVYLMQRPGWRGEGTLVSLRGRRGTVLIPELDLEPRVHVRGNLALNDTVQLSLRGVNLPTLEANFQVLG